MKGTDIRSSHSLLNVNSYIFRSAILYFYTLQVDI